MQEVRIPEDVFFDHSLTHTSRAIALYFYIQYISHDKKKIKTKLVRDFLNLCSSALYEAKKQLRGRDIILFHGYGGRWNDKYPIKGTIKIPAYFLWSQYRWNTKMIYSIFYNAPKNVFKGSLTEIARRLDITPSSITYSIKKLKSSGIMEVEKVGKEKYKASFRHP